ncbi:MAG: hypothetical protein RJA78_138 [Actinomycetota bacterium]|jgi:hypothetical protein
MAKNKKTNPETPSSKLESFLGYGFIACVGLTVLSVLVILFAAFSGGSWTPVGLGLVPMLVLPLGFIFLIALLVLSNKRKNLHKQPNE